MGRSATTMLTAIAVLLAGCSSGGPHQKPPTIQSSSPVEPALVNLPPMDPGGKAAVSTYLAGPGKIFLDFRDISAALLTLPASDPAPTDAVQTCNDVGSRLTSSVDPSRLLTAAQGIPDATLAELAVDERSARADLLRACIAGHLPTDLVRSAAATSSLIDRRLQELK